MVVQDLAYEDIYRLLLSFPRHVPDFLDLFSSRDVKTGLHMSQIEEARWMMLSSVGSCRSLWLAFRPASELLLSKVRRLLTAPNLKILYVEDAGAIENEQVSENLKEVVFYLRDVHRNVDVWCQWGLALTDECRVESVTVNYRGIACHFPDTVSGRAGKQFFSAFPRVRSVSFSDLPHEEFWASSPASSLDQVTSMHFDSLLWCREDFLTTLLPGRFANLRELSLGTVAWDVLASLARSRSVLPSLEKLDVVDVQSPSTMRSFWTGLSRCFPRLRELSLTVHMSTSGTVISEPEFFRETLPEAFPQLEKLTVDGHSVSVETCLAMVTRFVRFKFGANLRELNCRSSNAVRDEQAEQRLLSALTSNGRHNVVFTRGEPRFSFMFSVE
jgi:hypothetical protein